MPTLFLLVALFFGSAARLPAPTGSELIRQSIAWHDPQGQWATLRTRLHFRSTNAAGTVSTFAVELDNRTGYFCYISHREDHEIIKAVVAGREVLLLDGRAELSEAERKQYRLGAGMGQTMRNYYTYLYGLPMKLQDAGTLVTPETKAQTLLGQEYLTAEVRYDPAVGTDSWTFYFDPTSAALQAYRFTHNRTPNDGEYILLRDVLTVDGIRLPKERKWYLNQDNAFLATDLLESAEPLTKPRL
ncbi:DUF6503 family protein [Hymenobacter rubripertinctus]|uniref:Outer membrane lipoprotein-sorting protein n=1 Tax=Hymenobacter rubripertinctus TaxID=2029981 RepID=A0A418R5V0_9BACT|nr:DUF6503 family protein [Hymenobacter rubripertinctus]RIY12940.1 hypothetical protein D0T11_04220 [Hymenobacter rubripertinctus]